MPVTTSARPTSRPGCRRPARPRRTAGIRGDRRSRPGDRSSSFKYLGPHLDGETLVELGLVVTAGGPAHDTSSTALLVPVPVARRLTVGAARSGHGRAAGSRRLDGTGFAFDWTGLTVDGLTV